MNNGAAILDAQELEENKRLLAAQRAAYSAAKRFDIYAAAVSLGIPIAFTLVQLFIEVPFPFVLGVCIVVFLSGYALTRVSSNRVSTAARIQQRFDSYVYGISFENGERNDCTVAQYASAYLKEHSNLSAFDHWYTVLTTKDRPGEAVSKCQRQNAAWTGKLMCRYLAFEAIIAVVILLSICLMICAANLNPASFAFLLNILEWMGIRAAKGACSIKSTRKLVQGIQHYNLTDEANIVTIQADIFEYRSNSYLVPDWFYNRLKDKDDEKSSL